MARLKLTLPDQFSFETELQIRISDVNYGGHMGNDAILRMVHEARMQYLMQLGFSEKDVLGKGLIMSDAQVVYKSEAFHSDMLSIKLGTHEYHKFGFEFYYEVFNKTRNQLVALVTTNMVFFDYKVKKISPAPDELEERFLSARQ